MFLIGYFGYTINLPTATGTITLTGSPDGNTTMFVGKWNPATSRWIWATSSTAVTGNAIAVSGSNVYITGNFGAGTVTIAGQTFTTANSTNDNDIFVAKYIDNGNTFSNGWAVKGGSTAAGSLDVGQSIAVSGNNIYVTGRFENTASIAGATLTSNGGNDIFLAKYVDNGSSATGQWATSAGGGQGDIGYAVAVSGANVYIGGQFYGPMTLSGTPLSSSGTTDIDLFLAKYIDNGTTFSNGWAVRGGAAGSNQTDVLSGIAVNGADVYFTGGFTSGATIAGTPLTSPNTTSINLFVAKYTDNGGTATARWARGVSAATSISSGNAVAVSGNTVYVGGYFSGNVTVAGTALAANGTNSDALLAYFTDNGSTVANGGALSGGATNLSDQGLVLSTIGNAVYLSGVGRNGSVFGAHTVSSTGVTTVPFIARAQPPSTPPTITGFTTLDNTVCVGSPVTVTATVGNVAGSYNYMLLFSNHIAISGTETAATFSRNLLAQTSGSQSVTLLITSNGESMSAVTNVTINALPAANLTNNGPLSCTLNNVTLTASGGTSYTFVNSSGTVLSGSGNTRTISSPGTYSVTVANASGCVSTTSTTVSSNTATVTVTNPSTTNATQGTAFSQNFTASGGATPRSFTLASGTLPTGLTLTTTGALSGTPTQNGPFPIMVRATDANGCSGVSATYNLMVNSSLTITNLSPARNVRSASLGSNIAVTFDQPLNPGAATLGALRVFSHQRGGQLNNGAGGGITASGNVLDFNPLTDFKPGETIFTTITPQAQSSSGSSLARGQVYQFTTQVGGTGRGNFQTPIITSVGNGPQEIRTGDLNNDGNLDFVVVNSTGNTVSIRLGTGTGSFTTPPSSAELPAPSSAIGLAIGDIDNDGDLDILAAGSTAVNIYRNNGAASFSAPTALNIGASASSLSMGDVDGDGDLDFVVANSDISGTGSTASLRLNNGSGQFTTPAGGGTITLGNGSVWVALHDLDGDGDLDLLGSNAFSNNLSIRLNDGNGQFTSPASTPQVTVGTNPNVFAVGDIDNDGDLDVAVGNGGSNTASILKNNGNAQLTNVATLSLGNQSQCVALGDVDSDGDLDLISANGLSNTLSVRLNDGLGNFTAPVTNPNPNVGGNFPVVVVLGDVDNDGDLDALTNNFTSNNVSTLLNQPSGPTITGFAAIPNAVCAGSPVTFTATVGNVTGNYNYTLTSTSSTTTGTLNTTSLSLTRTASGSGSQSFTLIVNNNGQTSSASTNVTLNAFSPDYQALVDLYNTTNGPNWVNKTGWLNGCDPCTGNGGSPWENVGCVNGRVTGLYLIDNNLTGSIPTSLSALTNLNHLDLQTNRLSGPIPASLGTLTSLTLIILGQNQLTGSIPASLSALTNINHLDFFGNYLSGSIPTFLGNLVNLTNLNLALNQFSGDIPASLSALTNLTYLELSENQLTGTLSFLTGLTNINTIRLQQNQLSGTIPASLANLTQLQNLNLGTNRLSGCFPLSLSALCGKNTQFGENPNLPGEGDFATFCANPVPAAASATTTTPVVAIGGTVSLSATGGAYYSWIGPNSFTANVATPSFVSSSTAQSGTYSVTVSNGSCTGNPIANVNITVTSLSPTIAGFAATPNLVCSGSPVTFTATVGNVTGNYTYTITNGTSTTTGATSNTALSHTLPTSGSGVQSFSLIVSNNSQSASASTNVTVNAIPIATLTASFGGTLTCAQSSLTLTATGGTSYNFAGPGVLSQNASSGTAVVNTSGIYSVTVTSSGCSSTTSLTIYQDSNVPTVSISPSSATLTCTSPTVSLSAIGSGTYLWNTGATSQTIAVTTANTYSVTLTAANGCTASASATVTQDNNAPTVSINPSSATLNCATSAVSLSAVGTGTYRWNTGATTSVISATSAVSYSVTLTAANGCTATASAQVSQDSNLPTASISPSSATLTCANLSVTLTASGGNSYRWNDNSTNAVRSVSSSGTYSVTVTSGNGCTTTASAQVFQDSNLPTVIISANPSLTIAVGQSTILTASGASSYTWSTGSNSAAITVNSPGTYSVIGTNGNGCSATASVVVSQTTTPSGSFTITGVNSQNCQQIAANRYVITFTPQYSGTNGQPISFSVVNELFPTTAPGPYTLQLYTDNPVIVLKAQQQGSAGEISFNYNWLANCTSPQPNTPPRVNQPLTDQLARVGEGFGYTIPQATFTDNESPQSLVVSVLGLPAGLSFLSPNQIGGVPSVAGVSSVTVTATDPGGLLVSTQFVLTVIEPNASNTPPTLVNPIAAQVATQGQPFGLSVNNTFTDAQTPNALTLTAGGLPTGLQLVSGQISGTPSVTGTSTVMLMATDPGGLSASTSFVLTVNPVSVSVSAPFAITGVTPIYCNQISANRYAISFQPQYSGLNGQAVNFWVVNEFFPTTAPGPYSLQLYNDNPVIVLKAQQAGSAGEASFSYNWLATCQSPQPNTPPRVNIPLTNQTAKVGEAFGYSIPQTTFTDNETPHTLVLTVTGLPAGLSFSPPAQIGGVPSMSGVSSVTVTATDPNGLTVSSTFVLTVNPANTSPNPTGFAITGVSLLNCESLSGNRRRIQFTPQYSGLSGAPVSFSVVNELLPTTAGGPYTLELYTDNSTIQLRAQQGNESASYGYNWLAACTTSGRQAVAEKESSLRVVVMGNPVEGNIANIQISGATGQRLTLRLTNIHGRSVHQDEILSAREREEVILPLEGPSGLYLLQVSTSQQQQIIKLVKP
ncbi:hypothetical protein GCM10028807_43980 [Spirosoma daeguense]